MSSGTRHRVGEIDIRIAANGDWYHDGELIKRFAIARVFSTILRLDEGQHFLVTPGEKLRIHVDDAPFLAVDMETEGEGRARRILFTTNMGDVVLVDADHPIRVEERHGQPRPYVEVRRGLRALIARSVFYRLVDLARRGREQASSVYGVTEPASCSVDSVLTQVEWSQRCDLATTPRTAADARKQVLGLHVPVVRSPGAFRGSPR